MTLFTDNPFEKMMIQRPGGRRDNAPPVPKSPACVRCPYKAQSPCIGYCLKQAQEKKHTAPGILERAAHCHAARWVFVPSFFLKGFR